MDLIWTLNKQREALNKLYSNSKVHDEDSYNKAQITLLNLDEQIEILNNHLKLIQQIRENIYIDTVNFKKLERKDSKNEK